jgi:hypothetical protein
MPGILRRPEVKMRPVSWWLAAGALGAAASAHAQLGPSEAYPINTASPPPAVMHFDQKDRQVEVEITVGANGHTLRTRLMSRSGSGVYDERVRGYWKDQPFVPALDADGHPRESTVVARNSYFFKPMKHGIEHVKSGEGPHFRAEIVDRKPDAMASRIERMTCRDLLWEYDFMRGIAPKAKLQHEEIFHVAFAMLIAARQLDSDARDSLIAQWDTLIGQTLDACRAQPAAPYWKDAFVHTFESATPVGVNVQ